MNALQTHPAISKSALAALKDGVQPDPNADDDLKPTIETALNRNLDLAPLGRGKARQLVDHAHLRSVCSTLHHGGHDCQIHRIGQLSDQWSFLRDKRRSLWIAAEDCPEGEQAEEPDLDVLLAKLLVIAAAHG